VKLSAQTELAELELRRDELEESIDSLSAWMIGFTTVVVIGLVMELIALGSLGIRQRQQTVLDLAGEALVTLGVCGELSVEFRAHRKEGKLRAVNAEISAEDKRKLSAAETRIAELNLAAEQERHARVRIESYLNGRVLTSEQMSSLRGTLSRTGPRRIYIATAVDRFEATQFAAYLEAALRGSSWEVISSDSKPRNVLPLPGVQVFATPDNDSQDAAMFLSETLLDLGVLCCHYTASSSLETNSHWDEGCWPDGLYDSSEKALLLVVNETPPPEPLLPQDSPSEDSAAE
jgi:hypothetical protein